DTGIPTTRRERRGGTTGGRLRLRRHGGDDPVQHVRHGGPARAVPRVRRRAGHDRPLPLLRESGHARRPDARTQVARHGWGRHARHRQL
ncbi:MAG: hypothetical protein AVDCRST_MAG54-863, partial [uncultured Actinomycetospora sp.]